MASTTAITWYHLRLKYRLRATVGEEGKLEVSQKVKVREQYLRLDRPESLRAPGRAYAMKAREDQNASDVTAGTFNLFGINIYALIEPASTHSYISS